MGEHNLMILSLRDLKAVCTCGGWSLMATTVEADSDDEIRRRAEEVFSAHAARFGPRPEAQGMTPRNRAALLVPGAVRDCGLWCGEVQRDAAGRYYFCTFERHAAIGVPPVHGEVRTYQADYYLVAYETDDPRLPGKMRLVFDCLERVAAFLSLLLIEGNLEDALAVPQRERKPRGRRRPAAPPEAGGKPLDIPEDFFGIGNP